jgi:hypothetical protein
LEKIKKRGVLVFKLLKQFINSYTIIIATTMAFLVLTMYQDQELRKSGLTQ